MAMARLEEEQNSSATCGKGSGSIPPPAPASVRPAAVQRGGAARVQNLTGDAGIDEPEREGGRDGVWVVAGRGVHLLV
jgi:hypothetical protein